MKAAIIISVVFASTALLSAMIWLFARSAQRSIERCETDPRYLRRRLRSFGLLYFVVGAFLIVQVAKGEEPIETLFGLPIGLLLGLYWLRTASKVPNPQDKTD